VARSKRKEGKQMGISLTEQKDTSRTSLAALLHLWQTAAQVVASDPIATRKQAYEQAIDLVSSHLPLFTTVQDLANQFWQAELQATATIASLSETGRILNHQVVAAAACWSKVAQRDQAEALDLLAQL
jgi:hypothetical protein